MAGFLRAGYPGRDGEGHERAHELIEARDREVEVAMLPCGVDKSLLEEALAHRGEFARYWPTSTDPEADHMNALPKYVVSATLRELHWNNSSLISGDVAKEVAELKREPGGDILLLASAGLAHSLRAHGLTDEYRIWVDPIVHGRGKRYFAEGGVPTVLQLAQAKTLGSDGIVLTYTAKPSNSA